MPGPVDAPPGRPAAARPPRWRRPRARRRSRRFRRPLPLRLKPLDVHDPADAPLLKFAHTANREWNHGGHVVAEPFSEDQGYWDYSATRFYAAWLFDRPSSWFGLFALTGDATYRGYALRDLNWYASQINADGYFIPKANGGENDTKYGYVTPFLHYERLTGDKKYRAVATRVYRASLTGFPDDYSAGRALWTEREVAIHLEAAVAYYELTGDRSALNHAGALVRQFGAVAAAHDGAPQVSYTQHEGGGPGGTTPTSLTNSPWMTALYFQSARTFYRLTGDQTVLQQASAYFDWLAVHGLYDASLAHPEFNGLVFPRYLTGPLIGDAGYGEEQMYHCLDVGGFISFAIEAKRALGRPTAAAEKRLSQMKTCAVRAFANLTRDGGTSNALPKHRIKPARMWMWWVRGRLQFAP